MNSFKIDRETAPVAVNTLKFMRVLACCMVIATNAALSCGRASAQSAEPVEGLSSGQKAYFDDIATQAPETRSGSNSMERPLTLDRAVEIALANNPEIAAIRWSVSAVEARLSGAGAGRWPSVSAEAGYGHFLDPQRLIPTRYNGEPGVFGRDIYRGDLVLRLPLFTGGRITNEIEAAELLLLSEEKRLARSREELVFNLASTFYAILSQREVIRSVKFSVEAMEEHRKQVSDLLAVQKAARVDLLRTEVRLADLRQGLLREQNILAVQRRLLVNLMGLDTDGAGMEIEGTLLTRPGAGLSMEELMPVALKMRADYLAAKAAMEAQSRRVDSARAGYWPNINLVGSYGIKGALRPEDEGRNTKQTEDVGSIGLALTVPLFDGGRIAAKVHEEAALLAAAQERLRKLGQQIRREVETAVLNAQSSAERIGVTRQAIEQAREGLRIERMKYELSSGSLTDVLDAQSALLQSETNYARALADYQIARAKLRLATGEDVL